MSGLEVLRTGTQTLLQDLGRPGLADQGVSRSGAADLGAYLLGGRLLGHHFAGEARVEAEEAGAGAGGHGPAALEITLGGFEARVHGGLTIALTGAQAPVTVDDRPVHEFGPVHVRDGQIVRVGRAERGLRIYLSVRGGFAVEPVLGSRSRDTLAGIGPVVTEGMLLPVGDSRSEALPIVEQAIMPSLPVDLVELDVLPGPRGAWLADPGRLATTAWTVSDRSDRIGLRLDGEPLQRHPDLAGAELPSEGVVRGSVQIPAGGQPVIFLVDHPVTGGYPCVGVLSAASADAVAQALPGQQVRLGWVEQEFHR